MRDSHEKGAEMRDQDPPFQTLGYQMLAGEFSLVDGEFCKKYFRYLMNTLNTSPDYTNILGPP